MISYFYDSYSIIAYLDGNTNYKKYFTDEKGITTKLNLMEVYYKVLKEYGEAKAELNFDSFMPLVVGASDDVIKRAMKLRLSLQKQKKNISYVDAIGYQIALDNNLKFLTGDREFKDLKNVEFVR